MQDSGVHCLDSIVVTILEVMDVNFCVTGSAESTKDATDTSQR